MFSFTFHDLTTTICFNCYYSVHFLIAHNNNCSIDLYNRDLQTTIILFTHNLSSHKTDWIPSELPLLFISQDKRSVEGKCVCLREISINANKLLLLLLFLYVYVVLAVLLQHVYLFISFFILHFVVACLLLNSFFILILLLYFCLFVVHVNLTDIFGF